MKKMEKIKRRIGKWTKQEDEMLLSGVKLYGARHWKKISTLVTGKDRVRSLSSNAQSIHDVKKSKIENTVTMSISLDESSRSERQQRSLDTRRG